MDKLDEDALLDGGSVSLEGPIDESILDDEVSIDRSEKTSPANNVEPDSDAPQTKKGRLWPTEPSTRATRRSTRTTNSTYASTSASSAPQSPRRNPPSINANPRDRKRPAKETQDDVKVTKKEEADDEPTPAVTEDEDIVNGNGRAEDTEEAEGDEGDANDDIEDIMEHDLLDGSDGRINIGPEYQAVIAESESEKPVVADEEEVVEVVEADKDQMIWSANDKEFDDVQFRLFCEEAGAQLGIDRALFILYKNGHDFEKALLDARKRRLVKDEWSDDDRTVFKNAFQHYGKNFKKIKHALPHRSMTSIVNFYYNTKKEVGYKQLVKNQYAESESDDDEDGQLGVCDNCGEESARIKHITAGRLCRTCRVYFNIQRRHRPTRNQKHLPPDPCGVDEEQKRDMLSCPADMVEIANELEQMVREIEETDEQRTIDDEEEAAGPAIVLRTPISLARERNDKVRNEIFTIRGRCLSMQAALRLQQSQTLLGGVEAYRSLVPEGGNETLTNARDKSANRRRLAYQWTDREKMMVVHFLARYGKNFDTIAALLGTKSSDQIAAFYGEHAAKLEPYMKRVEQEEEKMARAIDIGEKVDADIECLTID